MTAASSPRCLSPAAPDEKFYGVHATYDEDEGKVELRVSDYRQEGGFKGLASTDCQLDSARSVILARRLGPRYTGYTPAPPSGDALAIVQALGNLQATVEAVARSLSRP
ncbi:hypothetical protein [Streptomyces botrytidirepellens]|uniref:Uncharacterized protein n=1 Tax=Streptomyces botrytidirepellens TaxID=2486417 RepID=A0A3M8WNN4_9ACTN|nr:hypothetical protein [Streptomyces botrytidirepellens]RNG30371.1 hypothetical protein EEJ42_10825 [Streptomyces botrytidirepellens]